MQSADFARNIPKRLLRTPDNHWAFVPRDLPPHISWTEDLVALLADLSGGAHADLADHAFDRFRDLDAPADDDEERTLVAFVGGVLACAEAKIGGRLRDALELVRRDPVGEQRQRGELGDRDHGRTRTVTEPEQIV